MNLESLFIKHVGPNVICLSAHALTIPMVYVHFDFLACMAKFFALA